MSDFITNILPVFNILILEILLSVDNAAVLATMVQELPERQRKKALTYGIVGAYVLRGLSFIFVNYLLEIEWLKILGGAYLVYLAYNSLKGLETGKKFKFKFFCSMIYQLCTTLLIIKKHVKKFTPIITVLTIAT